MSGIDQETDGGNRDRKEPTAGSELMVGKSNGVGRKEGDGSSQRNAC